MPTKLDEDGLCDCDFDPYGPEDEDYGEESWHHLRTCLHCGHSWYGLHCVHDGYQNPCPHCDVRPTPAPEGIIAPQDRARQKQAQRDEDHRRLEAGEVTAAELQEENNFFRGLGPFKIVAIGKRRLTKSF
jgi:hypothetical protein